MKETLTFIYFCIISIFTINMYYDSIQEKEGKGAYQNTRKYAN